MNSKHDRVLLRGAIPIALLLSLLVLLIAPVNGREENDASNSREPAQADPRQDALERLQADSGGQANVSHNSATGVASFVRLPHDGGLALTAGLSAEAEARAFLAAYGAAFGVQDPDRQLQLVDERRNLAGHTQLSYKQVHEGVDVFAGMLRVQLDGSNRVVSANGAFVPGIKVDTTPSLTAETAMTRAVAHVQQQMDVENASTELAALNTHLYLFREGLVQRIAGDVRLVYEVEVANSDVTVREFVYVDAHNGAIVEQITGIYTDLDRKVSEETLSNVIWEDSEGDPDPITAGWEGGSAQDVADWQDEIDGAKESYNLFASMAGRDSYDGAGATMRTVNNDPNINCPNANWNGTSTNYCTGVTSDDVVAHEWGHAYTQFTNDLIYQWQSGALNESYSDIWGETVDQLNGRGTDAPDNPRTAGSCSIYGAGMPSTDDSYRWLMGEDATAFPTAIRDMWNPTCNGDPGKVSDTSFYECTTADSGGVHINSGIPNHAFALLVDGGTYNGQTVTGIGLTKAAYIHWEAQNMLTASSNFVDHADALEAACTML
ncbi:MAG: M4 family metallopeptidase, partial [Chloroflexota bacterium]